MLLSKRVRFDRPAARYTLDWRAFNDQLSMPPSINMTWLDNSSIAYPDLIVFNSPDRHASIGTNGITMSPGAQMDMPGVLAAGRVDKFGSVVNQWGCKDCSCVKYNGQTGKYKITHKIGHNNYFVNVTPVSNGNWTKVHGAILEKTTTYVVVGIFDSGYDNTTLDYDFEFMICGRN